MSDLDELGLAVALISLDDLVVRAVTEAGRRLLKLPANRVIGRPVSDFIDPSDRPAARAAMTALQAGAIEFCQAHRTTVGKAHATTGFCAWVRAITRGRDWIRPRSVGSWDWPFGIAVDCARRHRPSVGDRDRRPRRQCARSEP